MPRLSTTEITLMIAAALAPCLGFLTILVCCVELGMFR